MFEQISRKIREGKRISGSEALFLYKEVELDLLKVWANSLKEKLNGKKVFYNRNIHFEPTNKCIYSCKFCSFYRKVNDTSGETWDHPKEYLLAKLDNYPVGRLTEVHITGGIHPKRGVDWAVSLLSSVKNHRPEIHIKAFTAVEVYWFARLSKMSIEETLKELIKAGLGSLPGGGAEIFEPKTRRKMAGTKVPANHWLKVHRTAHDLGLKSNASMLYGHIESYEDRIDHMQKIRDLQDETQGFNCFIPLKYRQENNELNAQEIGEDEDWRCYAISRLFLDNIQHLKAYWVMLGVESSLQTMECGVDDLDGTIDDSTKIYSMAGAMNSPRLSVNFLEKKIREFSRIPVERDSLYKEL